MGTHREEDPRFIRSRQALIASMTGLLEDGASAAEIRVSDLVRQAGVSRPTFYQHFSTIPDLVRTAAVQRLATIFEDVPEAALGESWSAFTRGTFTSLLTSLRRHARFFLTAVDGTGGQGVLEDIIGFLRARLLNESPLASIIGRRAGPDSVEERAEFLAAGVVWLCLRWLRQEDGASVPEMVDRISSLLLAASGASRDEQEAVRTEAPPSETGS